LPIDPISPITRVVRQRAIVAALTRRELSARYRGGALGYLWSLLNPLLLLGVYAVVFQLVFRPRADVAPYALFLFGGILAWGFVSASLLDASETFRAHGPLLRKTTAAPEVFPASAVAARLTHLALALPVLLGAIAYFAWRGEARPTAALLQLPIVLALLALAVFGLSLAVSSLSVIFGDVRDIVSNLLTLFFFLTPVLYPASAVPERFRFALWINPFAPFLTGVHACAFEFRAVAPAQWAQMAAVAAAALLLGGAVFERLRDAVVEEA
jgi:ABC-type polysaccharide/polyol phosphate export permease